MSAGHYIQHGHPSLAPHWPSGLCCSPIRPPLALPLWSSLFSSSSSFTPRPPFPPPFPCTSRAPFPPSAEPPPSPLPSPNVYASGKKHQLVDPGEVLMLQSINGVTSNDQSGSLYKLLATVLFHCVLNDTGNRERFMTLCCTVPAGKR